MPRIKRTVIYKDEKGEPWKKEVKQYYSGRYGKKTARSENKNKTPEDVKIINQKKAAEKLAQKITANFKANDLHISLTYPRGGSPDYEQSQKDVKLFLKKLRKYYKDIGRECKYIWTTDVGRRGSIHHHFIIEYMDIRLLKTFWDKGKPAINSMLDGTGNYIALAEYVIKKRDITQDSVGLPNGAQYKKRYNCSRNLKMPEIKHEIIHSKRWRQDPKPPKGWRIEKNSIYNGHCPVTGNPIQAYAIIKTKEVQIE